MSDNLPANLIRAYVDGELPPEDAERVETRLESDPEFRSRVEFEQALRKGVFAAMDQAESKAPEALRERISAALQVEQAEAIGSSRDDSSRVDHVAPAATQTAPAREVRPGWMNVIAGLFGRPQQISGWAMAGVVVIVSAVILVGIFGTPIDFLDQRESSNNLVTDVSEWIADEHTRCAEDKDVLENKLKARCREKAAMDLVDHLGVDRVTIFDLSAAGYEFVGEGSCGVPGSDASSHIIYERNIPGQPPAKASIFVMPDKGQFSCAAQKPLTPGKWYEVQCRTACKRMVRQSTDSTLVYFLVCCDERDMPRLSDAIGRSLVAHSGR